MKIKKTNKKDNYSTSENGCYTSRTDCLSLAGAFYNILAVHHDTARREYINLPEKPYVAESLLLASTADGRLTLLHAENHGISMWVMSKDSSRWAPHAFALRSQLPRRHGAPRPRMDFEWFGAASGGVLLRMHGVGLVWMNLGTKDCHIITGSMDITDVQFCPYEMRFGDLLASGEKLFLTVGSDDRMHAFSTPKFRTAGQNL